MYHKNIIDKLFIMPTPAGAYYAVSQPAPTPCRKLLTSLFQYRKSPLLTHEGIKSWSETNSSNEAMNLLNRMQAQGWLQGTEFSHQVPENILEDQLPKLLAALSIEGKALLADHEGLHLAHCGFEPQSIEEISALSADLALLQARHSSLLNKNLDLQSSAWALVDAAGNSQVGFWPLFIGQHRFVLIIGGMPCLNQPILTDLIWALSIRYSASDKIQSAIL